MLLSVGKFGGLAPNTPKLAPPKCTDKSKKKKKKKTESPHETYNYARASEASKRLRNMYLFRSQNTCYICIMQSSILLLLNMVYSAINESIPTKRFIH